MPLAVHERPKSPKIHTSAHNTRKNRTKVQKKNRYCKYLTNFFPYFSTNVTLSKQSVHSGHIALMDAKQIACYAIRQAYLTQLEEKLD